MRREERVAVQGPVEQPDGMSHMGGTHNRAPLASRTRSWGGGRTNFAAPINACITAADDPALAIFRTDSLQNLSHPVELPLVAVLSWKVW